MRVDAGCRGHYESVTTDLRVPDRERIEQRIPHILVTHSLLEGIHVHIGHEQLVEIFGIDRQHPMVGLVVLDDFLEVHP